MADKKNDTSNGIAYAPVKTILISQPKPERSPYFDLEEKYGIKIDWRQFIHVEGVTGKDFRRQRVYPNEYDAVIFTSRLAIDHFFRLCEEMRIKMSAETRYFCLNERIANYLQKFIVYRKRKVFSGTRTIEDLKPALVKYRDKAKFLLPCSNLGAVAVTKFLNDNKFDWKDAVMYNTVSSDLSDLTDVTYDVLVFFSPQGIDSLYENFPEFKQNNTRIAVYGNTTTKAVEDRGLTINIKAPAKDIPSMTMALEKYLQESNKETIS